MSGRRGVGTAVVEALRAGMTNREALDATLAEFPDARTTLASVNWYRTKLRADGEDVPSARALSRIARDGDKQLDMFDDG